MPFSGKPFDRLTTFFEQYADDASLVGFSLKEIHTFYQRSTSESLPDEDIFGDVPATKHLLELPKANHFRKSSSTESDQRSNSSVKPTKRW